ncbi:MAG: flagellar hook-associated protein FlgK [Alphaproteobacteria bacterium]|nr:flagellar hook-associated protein FlgK [Alphaproteobacteria bacterium]
MSLSQALANASSALAVSSRRAGVTSNNIANALTDGFNRRDVTIVERAVGGAGAGVAVAGIARATNPAVTFERRGADAEFAASDARANAFTRIGDLLGGPDDPNALFQRFAKLETTLRTLADTPDSGAAQLTTVNAAKDLASGLNRIANEFQTLRGNADAEISRRVSAVNTDLQEIERLNTAIGRGGATGGDVSALLDQRQLVIDRINESIPVRELQRDNGKIDLMTQEGVFLLVGTARTVEFTPAPVMTAQSAYNNGAGALSGLSVDGDDITPGGTATLAVREGAFAGLFDVRDRLVPETALALDAVALDLAERFSGPGLDPTLAPGAPGLFTDAGALVNSATLTGLAGRIEINAAVDPANGGLASRLRDGLGAAAPAAAGSDVFVRALIDVMNTDRPVDAALQTSRDVNASEAAAQLTSLAGAGRAAAVARAAGAQTLAVSLAESEKLETGVDTDRELQNLITIEQAFAANARVIQTVDRMLQRLMEI